MIPEPIRGDLGAAILGPRNIPLERENPDLLASPPHRRRHDPQPQVLVRGGAQPSHGRRLGARGHGARAAGRDDPGRREHAAEARRHPRAALAQGGRVGLHARRPRADHRHRPGGPQLPRRRRRRRPVELPVRHPALDPGPGGEAASSCSSSTTATSRENETFLITDWFAHTPREVLAKNFGVPESAFANIPRHRARALHLPGEVPGPLAADAVVAAPGRVPAPFSYRLLGPGADPGRRAARSASRLDQLPGGDDDRRGARRGRARRHARAALAPERRRVAVLHLAAQARMTVFAAGGQGAAPSTTRPGDVGYVPFAHGPLHREHGQRAAALPRDVPQRPTSPTSR